MLVFKFVVFDGLLFLYSYCIHQSIYLFPYVLLVHIFCYRYSPNQAQWTRDAYKWLYTYKTETK